MVPASFKIGTLTYDVHLTERIDIENDIDLTLLEKRDKIWGHTIKNGGFLFGVCDASSQKIWIATKDLQGNDISKERIEGTFYHELAHALVGETAHNEVNRDEVFIEALSKNIQSYIGTISEEEAVEYIEPSEDDDEEEVIELPKEKKSKSKSKK